MPDLKFIHAADLHIDSPYKKLSSWNAQLAEKLKFFERKVFENLIQACIKNEVDFLLIAGDSFDSEYKSLSAQYRLHEGFKRLKENNIKVYLVCGNHDFLSSWSKHFSLPENVYLFDSNEVIQVIFEKNGEKAAEIQGYSYPQRAVTERVVKDFRKKEPALFSIGLLHGNLAGSEGHDNYCPFSVDDLRATQMDYFALGHIHKRMVVSESNPLAVYPGNILGRHFNESGPKGCSLVEVKSRRIVSHRFLELSPFIFEYGTINLDEVSEKGELFDRITNFFETDLATDKSYLVRLQLEGRTPLFKDLSKTERLNELKNELNANQQLNSRFVWIDRIVNKTKPEIDFESLLQTDDFPGDIARYAEKLSQEPEELEQMINEIFQELKSSKFGKYAELPDAERKQQMLDQARWLCMNFLHKLPK